MHQRFFRRWLLSAAAVLSLSASALFSASTTAPSSRPSTDLTKGFKLQPLDFEVQHPYDLKLEDRYSFDKTTDTHDLWVKFTDKPHAPPPNKTAARTELRLKDENFKPDTGLHMLDCDLFIVPGTYACITQVFGTGPMAMIVVDQKGTIEDLRTHQVIAKDMYAKWFNWKVIFDTSKERRAPRDLRQRRVGRRSGGEEGEFVLLQGWSLFAGGVGSE